MHSSGTGLPIIGIMSENRHGIQRPSRPSQIKPWSHEGPYPSTEREIKFGRCMFTSSIKREEFSRRSCAKTGEEMYVQSCCFAYKICCFFFVFFLTFSLPSASLDLKVPNDPTVNNNSPIQDYIHPNDQPTFEITPGFKSFTHQKKHPGKYRKNNKNYKVSKSSDLYSVFSDRKKNSCYFCDFCDLFATLLGLFLFPSVEFC